MDANRAQQDYWTSPAGLKWIENEHALDTAMAGMLDLMFDAARVSDGDRVLDIGCGTGASTLAAAARATSAVGVDISQPLLDRAELRAQEAGMANAGFLLADAQTHAFDPGSFDVLVSRLGMSFFSDSVAAFGNLNAALSGTRRMAFVCWAEVDRNPWFQIPKEAAQGRLGPAPKGNPDAPGPNAFQNTDRVVGLMREAGLHGAQAHSVAITLTPPGGVDGAAQAASRVGPAARIMKAHQGSADDAAAIEDAVRSAFAQFDDQGEVRVPAVVNLFTSGI